MNDIIQQIELLKLNFSNEINKSKSLDDLENIRIRFLSRSGEIAILMQSLKQLSIENKSILGPLLNELKKSSESIFELKKQELNEQKVKNDELTKEQFDITAYKPFGIQGSLHPYTYVIEEIENIFISMGYEIAQGPELEDDFHNFGALNIPKDHPARDIQDTFWLELPGKLMRTHTSTIQIREMEKQKPPIAIFATGRCYRNEATDASHDFVFKQAECIVVDKNISISNLLATAKILLQAIFKKDNLNLRVRPGYFPFVEPGLEIDIECPFCKEGCSVCKKTRWIEMGGCGLIHPNVLESCNINPNEYNGFAFGFGLTRLVMLKYGINDVRLINSAKLEFLEQF